jgi:hypothetical protein
VHADDDYTSGPRVVGDRLAPQDTLDAYQRRQWGNVHAAAQDAFRVGQSYPYAPRPGVVVETLSLEHLARVTLRERRMHGVEWAEDPGAKPARRWD